MWLHYLERTSQLDRAGAPANTITLDALRGFIDELEARVAPVTIASYLGAMLDALRVMAPKADLELLRQAWREFNRVAEPSIDHRERLVGPSEFLDAALDRLERFDKSATTDHLEAVRFGDGLMMGLLVSKPVRLCTFAATRTDENLVLLPDGSYDLRYARADNKTKVLIKAELPGSLTPWINRWIKEVRPFLLGDRRSPNLWLTHQGRPMCKGHIYVRFCQATTEELLVRINPHLMRKIVATGVAVSMPEIVKIVPQLLDHSDDVVAREHYILADQLEAGRRHLNLLRSRRSRIRK